MSNVSGLLHLASLVAASWRLLGQEISKFPLSRRATARVQWRCKTISQEAEFQHICLTEVISLSRTSGL